MKVIELALESPIQSIKTRDLLESLIQSIETRGSWTNLSRRCETSRREVINNE